MPIAGRYSDINIHDQGFGINQSFPISFGNTQRNPIVNWVINKTLSK